MSFDYVWGTLRILGYPPKGEKLHTYQCDYRYYPFSYQGAIFTLDDGLWEFQQTTTSVARNTNVKHWPCVDEIVRFIKEKPDFGTWFLIALSDKPQAQTIDQSSSVTLSRIPLSSKNTFLADFSVYGFDVIDLSGLSALANIGYTTHDLSSLKGTMIEINQFGLISTASDSYKFAKFASQAAPEHAPFFPVKIFVKHKG